MRYLYIDTSSSYLYSAIVEDSNLLAEIKENYGQSLSEVALPKIVSMFEKLKMTAKDIDKIFVVNGPGSFKSICLEFKASNFNNSFFRSNGCI